MENIEIIEVELIDGSVVDYVKVWHNDNEYVSMPKSVWDELEAAKEAQSL